MTSALTAHRRRKRRRSTPRKRPGRPPVRQRPSWECSAARNFGSLIGLPSATRGVDPCQALTNSRPLRAISCHLLHRNSRAIKGGSYRNPIKALSRFQTETQARVFFAAVIRAALAAGSFHLEALRQTGVNLHGRRYAVEAEIGADVELHVRDDDPCECHIEARLGGLDRGVIVIVRP